MFVSRSMTRKVITVDPEKSVFEAQELMAHHGIRHLPVTDANQQLVGIVTDRDIRSAMPFNFIKDSCSAEQRDQICALTVKDIMTRGPVPVGPEDTVEKLASEGVKNMLVITPGFSSDCVETLEEIAIGVKETFEENGGENFSVVPCLNDSRSSIKLLKHLIDRELRGWV